MASVTAHRTALRWVLWDVVAWVFVPLLFLFAYIEQHSAPIDSLLPHLRLVLVILLGAALLRIVFARTMSGTAPSQVAASLVVAMLALFLYSYYGLVLIGLQTWGQVISIDLITSYAMQLHGLADALGIPMILGTGVLGLVYVLLVVVVLAYLRRFDWTAVLIRPLDRRLSTGILLLGGVLFIAEILHFLIAPATHDAEPIGTTLFPSEWTHSIHRHAFDRLSSEQLDRAEDMERQKYRIQPAVSRKNLILIVCDALRPDHMSLYGYARDTTPHMRMLEGSGMMRKISGVRSTCGESACGLQSLVSSKFVFQFSSRSITLQQVLKLHGYRINMILGGDHTNYYGLRALYGVVDSYFDGSQAKGYFMNDDRLVLDKASSLSDWDGHPTMLQFHFMSTHVIGKRHDASMVFLPAASYGRLQLHTADNIERSVNFYDNGVIQFDAMLNELLAILKSKKYLENSLVVITADHGESLGEHGMFFHGNGVYEEALRIPLVLVAYGYEPPPFYSGRPAVSQVDIAPTILRELGMDVPATWAGVPLQDADSREFTYFQEGRYMGLIDQRDPHNIWKYWRNEKDKTQYAFNLTLDANEQINVVNRLAPAYLGRLQLKLIQQRSARNRVQ
jgi:glucan phosphoethanolaminetransferase (alkaline phosphatase superfamily)